MLPSRSTCREALLLALGPTLLALLYRVWLCSRYWGQEEEDFGNLGTIATLWHSPFGFVELEHMPFYFELAGLAARITGGAERGGETVAVIAGSLGVGLCVFLGARYLSPVVGLLAGLLMVFQPESALYSATTLRESTYTALILAGIALVCEARWRIAAPMFVAAFLTRFDAMFTVLPVLLLLAVIAKPEGSPPDRPGRGALLSGGLLAAAVIAWTLWYHQGTGSWSFLGDVAERNQASEGRALGDMAKSLVAVLAKLLPRHLGLAALPMMLVGAWDLWSASGPGRRARHWLLLFATTTLALFLAIIALSPYHWDHNLYWKWLTPVVPFVLLLACQGAAALLRRLGDGGAARKGAAFALAALLLSMTGFAFQQETTRQLERSERWFRPQVELTEWAEGAFPSGTGMLCDLVPAYYQARRPVHLRVIDWRRAGLPQDQPEAFGRWLLSERIAVVVWFAERWVGAADAAPFLASGEGQQLGPARLELLSRQRDYGFIAYRVIGPGLPEPRLEFSSPP